MKRDDYLYPFEIVEEAVRGLAPQLPQHEADLHILHRQTLLDPDDGDDWSPVLALAESHVELLADVVVGKLGKRAEMAALKRSVDGRRLQRHDGCAVIIGQRSTTCNDLIAALAEARQYCCTEVSFDPDEGVYVRLPDFLHALRPRPRTPRPLPEPGRCEECYSHLGHDEGCEVGVELDEHRERCVHEIAAHSRCEDIADEMTAQIDALYEDIEQLAAHARERTHRTIGEKAVFDPTDLLSGMELDVLESTPLLTIARTRNAMVLPVLEDLDYCRGEWHSTPYRACRYLLT